MSAGPLYSLIIAKYGTDYPPVELIDSLSESLGSERMLLSHTSNMLKFSYCVATMVVSAFTKCFRLITRRARNKLIHALNGNGVFDIEVDSTSDFQGNFCECVYF